MAAAYIDRRACELLDATDQELIAELHLAYAADGFVSQYTNQTLAWEASVPLVKEGLAAAVDAGLDICDWRVLLELPLYRLRRRVDLILVTRQALAVVELKIGQEDFPSIDKRQVEEYALDLRDFHEFSHEIPIVPVLWCTEASPVCGYLGQVKPGVGPVVEIGEGQFGTFTVEFGKILSGRPKLVKEDWVRGAYNPVPSVIDAATTLFAGHGVAEIAQADAANLDEAANVIVSLISRCREEKRRALVFLTGVPGSGKTLAGLQVVHMTVEAEDRPRGDVVYLSGNTPLVTVLREALTEDEHHRTIQRGETVTKAEVRLSVRARIQHIMDFLREYISDSDTRPPHERAIVFDEAQRAWDAAYGKQKFGRTASEPTLLLDIMSRHPDWSVIVGLIGGGQEINSGENGMAEWGDALRAMSEIRRSQWTVYGPPGAFAGDQATAFLDLGELPGIQTEEDENLTLSVPLRSFRSPLVADWVAAVLDGQKNEAASVMRQIDKFPILMTRDSEAAQNWLQQHGRGERRYGMVASSTASRLRAEGFGVTLNATDRQDIAHWYLKRRGDVRSSFALEVTANEYTTQGLELDFVGLCWGGDLVRQDQQWLTRRFSGTTWKAANGDRNRFILNSYRVLMTRAREGLVIWIPTGDPADPTRSPINYDRTAEFLIACGVQKLE